MVEPNRRCVTFNPLLLFALNVLQVGNIQKLQDVQTMFFLRVLL